MKAAEIRVFDGLRITTEHVNHLQDAMRSSLGDLRGVVGLGAVVQGFGVELKGHSVIVGPGLAFDFERNRVVADQPTTVDLTFTDGADAYICIKYEQVQTGPVEDKFTLVWDSSSVVVRATLPEAKDNLIPLARATRQADGSITLVKPIVVAPPSGAAAAGVSQGVIKLEGPRTGVDLASVLLKTGQDAIAAGGDPTVEIRTTLIKQKVEAGTAVVSLTSNVVIEASVEPAAATAASAPPPPLPAAASPSASASAAGATTPVPPPAAGGAGPETAPSPAPGAAPAGAGGVSVAGTGPASTPSTAPPPPQAPTPTASGDGSTTTVGAAGASAGSSTAPAATAAATTPSAAAAPTGPGSPSPPAPAGEASVPAVPTAAPAGPPPTTSPTQQQQTVAVGSSAAAQFRSVAHGEATFDPSGTTQSGVLIPSGSAASAALPIADLLTERGIAYLPMSDAPGAPAGLADSLRHVQLVIRVEPAAPTGFQLVVDLVWVGGATKDAVDNFRAQSPTLAWRALATWKAWGTPEGAQNAQ